MVPAAGQATAHPQKTREQIRNTRIPPSLPLIDALYQTQANRTRFSINRLTRAHAFSHVKNAAFNATTASRSSQGFLPRSRTNWAYRSPSPAVRARTWSTCESRVKTELAAWRVVISCHQRTQMIPAQQRIIGIRSIDHRKRRNCPHRFLAASPAAVRYSYRRCVRRAGVWHIG